MGVLACDRSGCKHIMCDRYSYEYGYICEECFDELVRRGPKTNIEEFMDDETKFTDDTEASRAYFDVIFPNRNR